MHKSSRRNFLLTSSCVMAEILLAPKVLSTSSQPKESRHVLDYIDAFLKHIDYQIVNQRLKIRA